MPELDNIKRALQEKIVPGKDKDLMRFFKTGKGEYGEGDLFLGISVPDQRKVVNSFWKKISLSEVQELLVSREHEYRLTALLFMVKLFQKERNREDIVHLYLSHCDYINNWDLVDSSAPWILGPWLYGKEYSLLQEMAEEDHLWKQRIAVMATFHFIKEGEFSFTLELAELLLNHEHDLIHKAVGWMLREIGNRDFDTEFKFLKKHYKTMPRTMLRYAIEKFSKELRQKFLAGQIP